MNITFSKGFPFCAILFFFLIFSCKENQKEQLAENHIHTNALVDETSPYLLQHSHNPVNWRPWSQQALEDAKKENKLVIVSIGYSSCHWCHVMEEETFEDEEVAKVMNENFISIKVDREERPDVDQIYQDFQRLTDGNTGWPLNVIVLPNGKPFYGGTYHSKTQWVEVLTKMNELYKKDPEKAKEYTDMVTEGIDQINLIEPANSLEELTEDDLKKSVENWQQNWDLQEGGEKGTEKFMIPSNLNFLLDYAISTGDVQARAHVKNTLDKMALGGIYDQIGGGFHRYSTDSNWKVPHFEKMLYDNAQVLSLYSKAYTVFKDLAYKNVVWETIDFLDREMKNTEGGYYAALDAVSEGEEGKFYVWEVDNLRGALGDDFKLFAYYYTITEEAAWEENKYVLHRLKDDRSFLKEHPVAYNELSAAKARWNKKLLTVRGERTRPRSDDKIITSWNALLITGLVDSYKAFGQKEHLEMAQATFQYLRTNSFQNGSLVHTFKKGSRQKEGFLEDYAFLTDAALVLYGSTMNVDYLQFAQQLHTIAETRFSDEASGMYRYNDRDELIAKIIKTNDGALPSPNAVMAHNLFRLGHIEYNTEYTKKSKQMLSAMVPAITESASSYSKWNALLLNNTYPYYEIAVVGKSADALIKGLGEMHLPNTLIVGSTSESELPLFEGRFVEDGTYIYVCQNTTCKLPVETVTDAVRQMENF